MKIGILNFSRPRPDIAGIQPLVDAGKARGHKMEILYEPFFSFEQSKESFQVEIFYESKLFSRFDAIISRPNFLEEPSTHMITLDFLARAGYKILNYQPMMSGTKNKLTQKVILNDAKIPMPKWAIVRHPENVDSAAAKLGYPIIAKVAFGSWGKGVFYAENLQTLRPIVDYLAVRDRNPVILEEFIAEAHNTDIRALVVNGKIAAGMKRTAKEGEVRANINAGGVGSPVDLTDEEEKMSVECAKIFDLDFAGVDILRSNRGPLVIEVNSNPGLEGITEATGVDVAAKIIEMAEQRAKE